MSSNFNKTIVFILVLISILNVSAKGIEFDFADPKGVNSMSISLDSELEPIMGTASGISGIIKFDPDNPESITGKIAVAAKNIHMTNPKMTKVLHSEDWISAEEYPTVEFRFKEAQHVSKRYESRYELQLLGEFKLKGIVKEIQFPVTITYLPGKLPIRQKGIEGDLLILRTQFNVYRKDFNIKPDMDSTTVANKIDINVGIVGIAPKN